MTTMVNKVKWWAVGAVALVLVALTVLPAHTTQSVRVSRVVVGVSGSGSQESPAFAVQPQMQLSYSSRQGQMSVVVDPVSGPRSLVVVACRATCRGDRMLKLRPGRYVMRVSGDDYFATVGVLRPG